MTKIWFRILWHSLSSQIVDREKQRGKSILKCVNCLNLKYRFILEAMLKVFNVKQIRISKIHALI